MARAVLLEEQNSVLEKKNSILEEKSAGEVEVIALCKKLNAEKDALIAFLIPKVPRSELDSEMEELLEALYGSGREHTTESVD